MQTDPIGYGDDVNLYAYVKNDPGNATDPFGEQANRTLGAYLGSRLMGRSNVKSAEAAKQSEQGQLAFADQAVSLTPIGLMQDLYDIVDMYDEGDKAGAVDKAVTTSVGIVAGALEAEMERGVESLPNNIESPASDPLMNGNQPVNGL